MKKTVEKGTRKNKKVNLAMIITIIIILVLVIFALVFYYIKSNNIYNIVKDAKENEEISYNESLSFLMLNDSSAKIVEEKNLTINIEFGQTIITLLKDNVSNFKSLKFSFDKKVFNDIEDIKSLEVGYLERTDFNSLQMNLPDFLSKYSKLSFFALDSDNKLKEIPENFKIEEGRIKIDKSEYAVNGYILAYIPVKEVNINEASTGGVIYIGKGENKKLNINVSPAIATNKNYEIVLEGEEIISVDKEENILKGLNMGDSSFKVKYEDKEDEYKVHVSNYAKDISVSSQSITIQKGKSITINANAIPEDAENASLTFENKNENIITIEGNKITANELGDATIIVKTSEPNVITKEIKVSVVDTKIEVIDGITYVNGILIANKTYSLPSDYNPGRLLNETMNAFNNLKAAAANEGMTFWISSGFRSYTTQKNLYANYVAGYGKEAADTFSARAGHSEHQTGLAMDVNYIEDWFGDTKEGKWLAENAHKFGFIIRYPKSKEAITGYKYEPWHIRYLGVDIATSVYESGLCLEEYLGITSRYEGE